LLSVDVFPGKSNAFPKLSCSLSHLSPLVVPISLFVASDRSASVELVQGYSTHPDVRHVYYKAYTDRTKFPEHRHAQNTCQLWRTVGRHIHAVVVHCNYFQSFCCTFQFTNTTFSWHLFSPKKYERGNPRCTVWCVSHPLPQQLFGKREIINVPRHGISYGKS
jgi:hypothetical protein